jgi:hypothetical protein
MRRISLLLAAVLLAAMALAPAASAAKPSATAVPVPITGTIPSIDGAFDGVFNLTNVIVQNGQLLAVGTLTGTLTNAAGAVLGTVTNLPIQLPIGGGTTGSCQILHLELGPLDLNLLGLMVHLDKVVLDITAQSGSGNLLGNLLCAVAHLLDNSGNPLGGIAALLNNILGALG